MKAFARDHGHRSLQPPLSDIVILRHALLAKLDGQVSRSIVAPRHQHLRRHPLEQPRDGSPNRPEPHFSKSAMNGRLGPLAVCVMWSSQLRKHGGDRLGPHLQTSLTCRNPHRSIVAFQLSRDQVRSPLADGRPSGIAKPGNVNVDVAPDVAAELVGKGRGRLKCGGVAPNLGPQQDRRSMKRPLHDRDGRDRFLRGRLPIL
jgi:hypothetical protein